MGSGATGYLVEGEHAGQSAEGSLAPRLRVSGGHSSLHMYRSRYMPISGAGKRVLGTGPSRERGCHAVPLLSLSLSLHPGRKLTCHAPLHPTPRGRRGQRSKGHVATAIRERLSNAIESQLLNAASASPQQKQKEKDRKNCASDNVPLV